MSGTGGEPAIGRDGGGTEEKRREDGAGRREPLPGSEASRGNVEPEVDAPPAARETWMPGRGTQKSDPAED